MNVMSTFYCIQKHDDILKSGRKKYIIVYYTHKSKYTFLKIKVSYTGFRARIPGPESGPDSRPGFRAWNPGKFHVLK